MSKKPRGPTLSGTFWVRIGGMILFGLFGLWLGLGIPGASLYSENWRYIVTLTLASAGLGALILPLLTVVPMRWLRARVRTIAVEDLVAATMGLIVGLIVAALLALPLSRLPDPAGQVLPIIVSVAFGYIGIVMALVHKTEIYRMLTGRRAAPTGERSLGPVGILVDSSAIIDGRIADLCRTGFVASPLVVPRFILQELQRIADSDDAIRRKRGRRGLDVLNRLQKEGAVPVQITDLDIPEVNDVDSKLIQLARIHRCPILTTDFNLNRVAELQGVSVLNIHDLAQSVRPVVQPGEELTVQLVHDGKEYGQGVGYLDDGTMVVVDDGRGKIGQKVNVTVSRLLPTAAGRIVFAHLSGGRPNAGEER